MKAFSTNNQKRFYFHFKSNTFRVCNFNYRINTNFPLCVKYSVSGRLNLQLIKTFGDLL